MFKKFLWTLRPIGAFSLIEQRCPATGMRGDVCTTDDFGNLVSTSIPKVLILFNE